jgi:hypothetical protein
MEARENSCGQNGCGACCGGSCAGRDDSVSLTQGELDLLTLLAQVPFLPVAWPAGSDRPVCREDPERAPEALAAAIAGLEGKRLIQLDARRPLANFDYGAYGDCSARGSMALTALGQRVVELLDIQGIEE